MEELLENCADIVSEGFNEENLMYSMFTIALFKRTVSLHKEKWENIQNRLCGIFLFWWQKYRNEESQYSSLIKGYKMLREKNVEFPKEPSIRERTKKKV